jgi:hypothetical protein
MDTDVTDETSKRSLVCWVPIRNPEWKREIMVRPAWLSFWLDRGSYLGPCEGTEEDLIPEMNVKIAETRCEAVYENTAYFTKTFVLEKGCYNMVPTLIYSDDTPAKALATRFLDLTGSIYNETVHFAEDGTEGCFDEVDYSDIDNDEDITPEEDDSDDEVTDVEPEVVEVVEDVVADPTDWRTFN